MSLFSKRKSVGAVCPVCRSPDYTITPPYEGATKPNIKCCSCGNVWQYGRDGGIYAENMPHKIRTGSKFNTVKTKGK